MQQQEQQQQQLHKVIYCYILYTPSHTSSLRIFLGCESICLPCNFLFFPFHHSLADPTNYCVIVGNRDVNQLTTYTAHIAQSIIIFCCCITRGKSDIQLLKNSS